MKRAIVFLLLLLLIVACTPTTTSTPIPTQVAILKEVATVFISPTPNPQQAEATRLAVTPTIAPPTPTIIPSATPYIGVFIGQAQRDDGFTSVNEPLFADVSVGIAPTADASRCRVAIDPNYLRLWLTNSAISSALGCPIQEGFGFFGQSQIFENGVMYLNDETGELWAVLASADERTQVFSLTSAPSQDLTGLVAPPGLLIPEGRFANMWLSVENLQTLLGFAITPPQTSAINIQRYDSGSFFFDVTSGEIFAFENYGTAFGPISLIPQEPTPIPEATVEVEAGDS